MYDLVRRVAFRLDPERVHGIALRTHRALRRFRRPFPLHPVDVMGLRFPNVVGLAAGYDKDAVAWRGLGALGFGHVEVGTVTPEPQPGNPRPRIFRLPDDHALINRMGFPSQGMEAVVARLHGSHDGTVLGVSIGPNKDTPTDQAAADYERLVDTFAPVADYLAVNVSSPNTPGLRSLQRAAELERLLARVVGRRSRQPTADSGQPDTPLRRRFAQGNPEDSPKEPRRGSRWPPPQGGSGSSPLVGEVPERSEGDGGYPRIVVKLSPDLVDDDLAATVGAIESAGVDGIILTNTTVARPDLSSDPGETGGLSGAPLAARSLQMLEAVRRTTDLPLIASGGIMTVDDARRRLDAGASLVQSYTGFVYSGPSLVREIADLT